MTRSRYTSGSGEIDRETLKLKRMHLPSPLTNSMPHTQFFI